MKKVPLICILIFFIASASVYADGKRFHITPKVQSAYGWSGPHDDGANANPGIGAGVILGLGIYRDVIIEANAAYEYWFTNEYEDGIEDRLIMIPVLFGFNAPVTNHIGVISGMGLTFWDHGNEDGKEVSFYVGAEIRYRNFSVRPKLFHLYHHDGSLTQVKLAAGYRFSL